MYRRSALFGGGNKYVIILAANQGGGVMEWKGPREWAIERDSVKNKKKYTKKWDRGHEHKETLRTRVARELGEG
jgi:mannan polymerase II complex MNN10 subunit